LIKVKPVMNKFNNFFESITFKDVLFIFLILSIIFLVYCFYKYGTKETAEISQSLGIGLGSLFGGLAGLTAFLDWFGREKKAERYIKELRGKYPRILLNSGELKIVQKKGSDMIYLIDERDRSRRWFQDQEARKDLGFSRDDTSGVMTHNELADYLEESPIVAKKNFY